MVVMPAPRLMQVVALSLALHLVAGWGIAAAVRNGQMGPTSDHLRPTPLFAVLANAIPQPGGTVATVRTTPGTSQETNAPAPEQTPQTAGATPTPAEQAVSGNYLAASDLDVIPVPVTEPDSRYLEGMVLETSSVSVSLYIDSSGRVQQVRVAVPESEQSAAEPLKTMFRETQFVPGRKSGHDVAAILPIQINIDSLVKIVRHDPQTEVSMLR